MYAEKDRFLVGYNLLVTAELIGVVTSGQEIIAVDYN